MVKFWEGRDANRHQAIRNHNLVCDMRKEIQEACQDTFKNFPRLNNSSEPTSSLLGTIQDSLDDVTTLFDPSLNEASDFLAAFEKGLADAMPVLETQGYDSRFLYNWASPLRSRIKTIQASGKELANQAVPNIDPNRAFRNEYQAWFGFLRLIVYSCGRVANLLRIAIVSFSVAATTITTFLYGLWPDGVGYIGHLRDSLVNYWQSNHTSSCVIYDPEPDRGVCYL